MPKVGARPPGLAEVNRRLAELRDIAAQTDAEICVLEETARVLKALASGSKVIPGPAEPVDFATLTVPQAAAQVLVEAREPLHFVEITKRAFDSGFTGQRLDPNSPPEKAADSFGRMMRQRSDVFEAVGDGRYQIAQGATDPVAMVTPKKKRVFKKVAKRKRLTDKTLESED